MGYPLALRNLFINQEWKGWMCLVWVVNQEWSDTDYISIYTGVSLRDQVMNTNEIVAVTLKLEWPWHCSYSDHDLGDCYVHGFLEIKIITTWLSQSPTVSLLSQLVGGGGGLPIQKNILDALLFSTIYSRILKHFMQQQAARASCNYRHDYKDEWQYHALLRSPCVTRSTLLPCASSQWRHF